MENVICIYTQAVIAAW